MKKKRSKLKQTFNIIIFILLLIILFVYFVILVNSIINKEATLNFFRWKPFIVVSDSIEADVYAGDMAIVKDVKLENLQIGDTIVYRRENDAAIKKIKDIKQENGESKIIIENDNVIKNESINSYIEGKYMFKIPGLGNIMLFLQTPLGGIILFSIFIYIICIIKLISSRSSNEEIEEEKAKDEKTNEK